jgi:hypothetical protein
LLIISRAEESNISSAWDIERGAESKVLGPQFLLALTQRPRFALRPTARGHD